MVRGRKIQFKNFQNQLGFTLIELIVVIAVMTTILGLMLVNFNAQSASRNLRIAQNELISNIRKVQAYTLASRSLDASTTVQYYIIKFDLSPAGATGYTIQAISNATQPSPQLTTIETVKLPKGITLAPQTTDPSTTGLLIDNRPISPPQLLSNCALLIYKLPFGKVMLNDGCIYNSFINDDYAKIINFITNTNNLSLATDSNLTIRVKDTNSGGVKSVKVRGISGKVSTQ